MKFIEKQKTKNFIRLGCAALATMLAVGSVPFLRGFAAGNGGTAEPQTYNNSMTDGVLTIDQSGTINGWTYENYDMTSVIINADNVTVDTYAFYGCNALTSVTVNGNNAQFNNYSIEDCNALTSITVNGNNAQFNIYSIDECNALTSITVNGNYARFDENAFFFESNVTSVTISGSNPSFGSKVFSYDLSATITFQCPAIQSDNGFINLTDQSTVRLPCGFTVNGTTVTSDNASSFFGEANVAIDHSMTKTNAKAATCTEDGNIDYWTCSGCHKIFSDANGTTEITEADTTIAALGHDFHDDDWTTVTEATETTPGEEEHFCHRDGCGEREAREIPARPENYEINAESGKTWTKGSTNGMVVIIKNTNGDDSQTFSKLVSVSVDGTTLTRDTDYTAEPGSIKLTLSPDYLNTLAEGEHTLTVELTVTTLTHTFTVAAATDSPASDYQFTADSLFKWTKGSTDGLTMVIKNTSGDDSQTFDKLKKVSVDGTELTLNTDYTVERGSIKLTLSPAYLETLKPGEHTLTVELTATTLTHTFTVAAPASTDTPSTGESILLIVGSIILMLLAAGGVAYVLIRRKKNAE